MPDKYRNLKITITLAAENSPEEFLRITKLITDTLSNDGIDTEFLQITGHVVKG